MSNIIKDIGEIYTRLFDCRPFLTGELKYFVNEFEENRQDREIEGLFSVLQNTIELRDSTLERNQAINENTLTDLNKSLKETLVACEEVIDEEFEKQLAIKLEAKRQQRKKQWKEFVDDMTHKCSRVDNTFEEKKEELHSIQRIEMSKGSIKDVRITIKPSVQLIEFISTLTDEESMPENVLTIYKIYKDDRTTKIISLKNSIAQPKYTSEELLMLKTINENSLTDDTINTELSNLIEIFSKENSTSNEIIDNNLKPIDTKSLSKTQLKKLKEQQKQQIKTNLTLNLNDIKWINLMLIKKRTENSNNVLYLHELLAKSQLILPKNELIERNPELEERCRKLRMQQDAKNYRNMTRNVDSSNRYVIEDTVSYQMKQINRQLIAVLQFIFSVAAGFAFGFIGLELIIGNMDFGFRLLLGIMFALVIALAEIYFLAKRLNEEYEISVEQPKIIPNNHLSKVADNQQCNKEHID